MALLKENIPISTAYFRRLIQLRARYCIDALTFVKDNEEIQEVKAVLVQTIKEYWTRITDIHKQFSI